MEKEIKDCYGTLLNPGDEVITHTQWGSDAQGYNNGIVKCTVTHLSRAGRVMLRKKFALLMTFQRWPEQVVKINN